MKLAIVAYPSLDEADRQWIESFRAGHDPQAFQVAVHFTLVFPVEAEPGDVQPEVARVAQSTESFSFAADRISVVSDELGGGNHIFLVPEEGAVQITTLHDRLYGGVLGRHLRSDMPFVPHMTIGAAPDLVSAQRLATELRARARTVRGKVSGIALLDVSLRKVQRIASSMLRDGAASEPGSK